MRTLSVGAVLGAMVLLVKAALVSDVALGYVDCQLAAMKLAERPLSQTYQEQQALQKQAEAVCQTAQIKAKLAQAVLAPSTEQD